MSKSLEPQYTFGGSKKDRNQIQIMNGVNRNLDSFHLLQKRKKLPSKLPDSGVPPNRDPLQMAFGHRIFQGQHHWAEAELKIDRCCQFLSLTDGLD